MNGFVWHNPTRVVLGADTVARVAQQLPADARVLVTWGMGSARRSGVLDTVLAVLGERVVADFGGIEPNPSHETCMAAVEALHKHDADFILAVGGGSVADASKYIAAAARYAGDDPWDILQRHAPVADAVPLGLVLTLPATGTESNGSAVISRRATSQKLFFTSDHVYPRFAIIDPRTHLGLSTRQTGNGVVDAFVHVCEQYLTRDEDAPLQARQAEAILLTLIEQGPRVLAAPDDLAARANVAWCATQALNGLIGMGVTQDWATHMIGHELTAAHGLDHARTLAAVMPALLDHQRRAKRGRLLQYAARVWGVVEGTDDQRIDQALAHTRDFFEDMGLPTALAGYGLQDADLVAISERLVDAHLGESGAISGPQVFEILRLAR